MVCSVLGSAQRPVRSVTHLNVNVGHLSTADAHVTAAILDSMEHTGVLAPIFTSFELIEGIYWATYVQMFKCFD